VPKIAPDGDRTRCSILRVARSTVVLSAAGTVFQEVYELRNHASDYRDHRKQQYAPVIWWPRSRPQLNRSVRPRGLLQEMTTMAMQC
jgi:hypothetical protein